MWFSEMNPDMSHVWGFFKFFFFLILISDYFVYSQIKFGRVFIFGFIRTPILMCHFQIEIPPPHSLLFNRLEWEPCLILYLQLKCWPQPQRALVCLRSSARSIPGRRRCGSRQLPDDLHFKPSAQTWGWTRLCMPQRAATIYSIAQLT